MSSCNKHKGNENIIKLHSCLHLPILGSFYTYRLIDTANTNNFVHIRYYVLLDYGAQW